MSIIKSGRTVQSGSLDELRHLTHTTVIAETEQEVGGLADLQGISGLQTQDHRVSFGVDAQHLSTAISQLSTLGIKSLVSHPPTLEELFLREYGEEDR